MKFSKFYFSLICISFASNMYAEEPTAPYDVYAEAKELYLKSFFSKKDEEESRQREKSNEGQNLAFDFNPQQMNNRALREVIVNNCVDFEGNWATDPNTYNKYLLSDLNIYLGSSDTPHYNLIARINRTKTVVGELTLGSLICSPTSNVLELQKRQAIIQYLMFYKKNGGTAIDKILDTYKEVENNVSSLFYSRDPLLNKDVDVAVRDIFFFSNNELNRPQYLTSLKVMQQDVWGIFIRASFIQNLKAVLVPFVVDAPGFDPWAVFVPCVGGFKNMDLMATLGIFSFWNVLDTTLFTLIDLSFWNRAASRYERNDKILRGIAKRLYNISILLRLSTKLTEVIGRDEQLNRLLGNKIMHLRALKQEFETNKDLHIIHKFLLEKHEYLRDWHYYKHSPGHLLFIYNNLSKVRELLRGAIAEIGTIDAFCSCANLMMEHENHKNHFVFARYLSDPNITTPYVKLNNIWNPFLDADIAVPNTLEMGAASKTQCKNMIITGPNAGGKSTFVNSVLLGIILSQTIGIAPGTEILLTPFSKINSYIEVKDDIAAGKSSFIAEVDRSVYQFGILQSLQPNEFAFSIFDEPFRGTNPMEGAAVEYSILEKVGTFDNSLSILTTHYPIMTLLEDYKPESGFKNFKVYITKDENNRIKFTYKIIPGKSKQNIAIRLLAEQGYKNDIISRAREIVKNPKLFETKFGDDKIHQGIW